MCSVYCTNQVHSIRITKITIKITDVQQTKTINKFKNTNQKSPKHNAVFWFNNISRINKLTLKYIQIKKQKYCEFGWRKELSTLKNNTAYQSTCLSLSFTRIYRNFRRTSGLQTAVAYHLHVRLSFLSLLTWKLQQ
jgi:hypothetical protein